MENEIKVGEYIRSDLGSIGRVTRIKSNINTKFFYEDEELITIDKRIVKHSPNLKELIKVKDMIKIHNLKGDDISFWFEIFDDKTMMDFKLGLDSKEIEVLEVVTKEMMESITYKVTKM